uniref:Uncharacterized protein n=1 Tax=Meloidogyne enterolobii TaxID=390850 RepID=A0A6V7W2P6_MELEN|nr:unnamed protein product [Meloidogyne enterolobii]
MIQVFSLAIFLTFTNNLNIYSKEISDSNIKEDYCLLPDSEDDSLGFTNTRITENSLPNIQTELLDDTNKELNLNKNEDNLYPAIIYVKNPTFILHL